MNAHKLIPLFFISFIFCQFSDVQVEINYNQLDKDYHSKKLLIENIDEEIKNYFLFNQFCQEYDFLEMNLQINLIIESIRVNTNSKNAGVIKCHFLITNGELYYFDKSLEIEYNKNKSLVFIPNRFQGLESILNYFAFLYIGYELDTWGYNLGTSYLNKALEISSEAPSNSNWGLREDEIKSILLNSNLREARFLYFSFLDLINSEEYQKKPEEYENEIDGIINEFYNKIVNISIKVGYDKNTIKFLGYHVEDIADLFYRMDMQDALNFLLKYDIENEAIYEKYIK